MTLIVVFVGPDVLSSASIGTRLVRIGITVVAAVLGDIWFSRRMGVTIEARGLILHSGFSRRRVEWSEVAGFKWALWRRQGVEWLWIVTTGGQQIRVPTVQRAAGRVGFWGTYFGSPDLRGPGGDELDALDTMQRAHALATASPSGPVPAHR